ncbi:UNVERIFIED_CONTAM: hypothetical protein K2H54_008203 [Gekko kuhli]
MLHSILRMTAKQDMRVVFMHLDKVSRASKATVLWDVFVKKTFLAASSLIGLKAFSHPPQSSVSSVLQRAPAEGSRLEAQSCNRQQGARRQPFSLVSVASALTALRK